MPILALAKILCFVCLKSKHHKKFIIFLLKCFNALMRLMIFDILPDFNHD
jgi:hypothetical protein